MANGHRAWDAQWAGKPVARRIVSAPNAHSYKTIVLRILGKWYGEHRVVWAYMTGAWPNDEIDHINGDSLDNRFENLREATHSQNQMNSGAMTNNLHGVKGCGRKKLNGQFYGRYYAQIKVPGQKKVRHIGTFDTLEMAEAAYREVAARYHGEFLHNLQRSEK